MKNLYLILMLILASKFTIAQSHSKEIDVQFEKYKNQKTVTVTNAEGSIDFEIDTFLNAKRKPERIMLVGKTYNESFATHLIENLGRKRLKLGFKHTTTTEPNPLDALYSYSYEVYTKGEEYAKYGVNKKNKINYDSSGYEISRTIDYYIVLLEIGDISRQLNGQGTNFNF